VIRLTKSPALPTHLLIDTDVENVFASLAVLDKTLAGGSDASSLGEGRTGTEDRGRKDGLEVVGGRRSSVGGRNGSLLQAVQLEIGLTERLGDLELKGLGDLVLRPRERKRNERAIPARRWQQGAIYSRARWLG